MLPSKYFVCFSDCVSVVGSFPQNNGYKTSLFVHIIYKEQKIRIKRNCKRSRKATQCNDDVVEELEDFETNAINFLVVQLRCLPKTFFPFTFVCLFIFCRIGVVLRGCFSVAAYSKLLLLLLLFFSCFLSGTQCTKPHHFLLHL